MTITNAQEPYGFLARRKSARVLRTCLLAACALAAWPSGAASQTALGEIEGRPAPVSRRQCTGGAQAGHLCNQDADCPASTCQVSNIYNVTVAVRFNATAAQLTNIRTAFTQGSELLFDATDGQAQFGQVSIFNNSTGNNGHFWITSNGGCATDTGTWGSYSGGNITIGYGALSGADGPECVAHEFSHLAFDVRDEYESRTNGCANAVTGAAQCPDAGQGANSAGQGACLMECCGRVGTEFCWGQAAGDNLAAGNHDATNVTEQSICRANRSCWDQVAWAWPSTVLVPTGAPDPGSAGQVHQALAFLAPAANARLVLVLDRSGSMVSESPPRIERLRAAALDVVEMAEDGVELGLVSFTTDAHDEVAIGALGADRSAYSTAINGLTPTNWTNIGDGLQHAYDMITAAGGVTAQTAIILMTDGLNNRPLGNAPADLQQKVDLLLAQGVPVYVTCTGDDFGLDSQCAEIAAGTNGSYVDSAQAGQLPERFVSFFEQFRGRHPLAAEAGQLGATPLQTYTVPIEQGARVATFVAQWQALKATPSVIVYDPSNRSYDTRAMPLGRFLRVAKPASGTWRIVVRGGSAGAGASPLVVRTYVDNPRLGVPITLRHKVIRPGEAFQICARPLCEGPLAGVEITGEVALPDGKTAPITLRDGGQGGGAGDEAAGDGTYCAEFTATGQRGAYTFRLRASAIRPTPLPETQKIAGATAVRPIGFVRVAEVSGTVDDGQLAVDHFKCYGARLAGEAARRRNVAVRDQFGSGEATLLDPQLFCNAAEKDREGAVDKNQHLECYRIEEGNLPTSPTRQVEVRNQFGLQRLEVAGPRALCVPAQEERQPPPKDLDHFKCYAAAASREGPEPPRRSVTLMDEFGRTESLVVQPAMLCNPAEKNGEPIRHASSHLACYRIRDVRGDGSRAEVSLRNQFGSERLQIGRAALLCVPSTKEELGKDGR